VDTPSTGNLNVFLIPIDFSDAEGSVDQFDAAQEQIGLFNGWIDFHSRSALTFNWVFPRQWFRMPRSSADYGIIKQNPDYRERAWELASDGVAAADPSVDFTDNQFVYFLLPETIEHIAIDFAHLEALVFSDEGRTPKFFGGGKFFYGVSYKGIPRQLWSVWAHETGHSFGLAGHAPVNVQGIDYMGPSLHLMYDQSGDSQILSAWNQWLLGWMPEEEVYCLPSSDLDVTDVDLNPLERPPSGYRAAMVPLSETMVIVVESRRPEGYTIPSGGSGIVIYSVDTTKDNDRTGAGQLLAKERFAEFVSPQANPFLEVGQSVTVEGITVTYLQSDSAGDAVRISK
jgi:M6 family metalloprotease-like protein